MLSLFNGLTNGFADKNEHALGSDLLPENYSTDRFRLYNFITHFGGTTKMPEHFDKLSTAPKRPLKVFLCHAHADRDPVRGLYARLTKDGVDAWLDKAKLLPGQDWELEIRKAVREADVVVVCLSKQFNQAGFRQKEVRLALDTAMEQPEGEIFIIPARLEECDTLESLRRWHWVDLFEDDGYEMLMRALRTRADKIGATLQLKKSWLPIGNTQPAVAKKPSIPIEKPVEKKIEKPGWKKEIQTLVTSNKNIIGITGFIIVIASVIMFGLRPLIEMLEKPTLTATNTASFSFTQTPISPNKLPTISPSATITPTSPPPPVLLGGAGFSLSKISLKNIEQLELLSTINTGEKNIVDSDISPDGKFFVAVLKEIASSGVSKYSIRVWNIGAGTPAFSLDISSTSSGRVFVDNNGFYFSVCNQGYYCSDGEVFYVRTDDWQLVSKGKIQGEIVSLSRDGNLAVVAICTNYKHGWGDSYYCEYEKISVWNISTSSLTDIDSEDKYDRINSAVISSDNRFVAFNGMDRDKNCFVRVVELPELLDISKLYQEKLNCWSGELSFSPDNSRVAFRSGYQPTTTQIWNVLDGALLSTSNGDIDRISRFAFLHDGTIMVTSEYESIFNGTMVETIAKSVSLKDTQNQTILRTIEEKADYAYFSLDGLLMLTISNESHTLKIWGVRNP